MLSQPIFLHGGWRCGSTYLWSKFRRQPGVTAFYEPFSEKLATYTRKSIHQDNESAWNSRHPALDAPYAAEYLPLITGAGVPGYMDRFALERFFVSSHEPLEEADYLRCLLVHATNSGSYPVLGFSRSLGRVGAIRRAFGGYHVVLLRDPVQQWYSVRSYRRTHEPSYFELCHLLILALARPQSLAGQFAHALDLPRAPAGRFSRSYRFMRSRFERLGDELSYQAFMAVYLLSYQHALPEADLVIDMDMLSRSTMYRRHIAAILGARTGASLDFDDCALPVHDARCTGLNFAKISESVALPLFNSAAQPGLIDHAWLRYAMNRVGSAS